LDYHGAAAIVGLPGCPVLREVSSGTFSFFAVAGKRFKWAWVPAGDANLLSASALSHLFRQAIPGRLPALAAV
jgi:hypothetical protein